MPPRLAVRDIALFERPVAFYPAVPFGAVVVNAAPQAFVRAEIEIEGRGRSVGASAEMLVPKWFDKRAATSPEQTVGELRRSLLIARELYLGRAGFETAFGLHAACIGRRSRLAPKKTFRRSPRPMGRLKSTRPCWMRCCAGR